MADHRYYEPGSPAGLEEARRRITQAAENGAKSLDLGGLGLVDLPEDLPRLTTVKALWLGYPESVEKTPLLQRPKEERKLCNAANTLPAAFLSAFPHLQTLYLNGNQLTALPAEIGALTELQELHLDGNQLTALPAVVGALTALQGLHLDDNRLTALPAEIGALTALLRLHLNDNQLTALPAEIGALTALQRLYLDGNQLTALPAEIGALTALQRLDLDRNRLTALPAEIGALMALNVLYLVGNQLTALPAEIGAFTALQRLHLDHNRLTALPAEIGTLTALQRLDLDDNLLTALPAEIGALTALEVLNLDGNLLTALPAEIGALTALEVLYLDRNQLTALPAEIGALTALQRLHLDHNQLTALPAEIGALTALQALHLDDNPLTALPAEIGALTALQRLHLNDNELTALPAEIGALTALQGLYLIGNPLPQGYFDALEDGIHNLFALVRSFAGDTAPIYEAKLLITGEGQVGKSWALAALRREDPRDIVGSGNTTWGIERGDLPLPHPEEPGTDIHLNTWDFGGQKVYRVTHQFFFSEQALFLLVWNPRTGPAQCRVREWLRMIALRTGSEMARGDANGSVPRPRARVIMVATHAEAPGGNYSPEYGHDGLDADLRAMIVDSIAIDSETGYNIERLRDLVAHHAAMLPDMGSPMNSNWAAAREAALALRDGHPWITFGRFAEICAEQGVINTGDQRTLAATFMHRLGKAVWYGPSADEPADSADALLADTLVLDAVWLSRAFVQVLDDEPTKQSGGMLDRYRYEDIWTEHGRPEWKTYAPEEYERLVRMMSRFDVALPTRASSGERSLVPQLVPELRPSLPWTVPEAAPGKRLVRLACQLAHEAEGLMARTIAATEPYHVYQDGKGLFWQHGVFLSDSSFNNEALVAVEGREKPVLSIDVSGDQPGFLMTELYRTLESVIDFWKGSTRTYFIRCPARTADGGFCPGRFKFETVQRRAAKDTGRELDCQECDKDWTPEELLLGLEAVRIRREDDHQLAYLYHEKKIPCPRTFLLRPADRKWHNVTSWASFVGKRFHLTLVSELSGIEVASKEFSIREEWTKWIGPVARAASTILTGLAVPLEDDIAQQLSEGAAAMDKLGALPAEDNDTPALEDHEATERKGRPHIATDAQLRQLELLLQAIGLDPRANGMELAQTRDGRWLWMTSEEAAAHRRPEARLGPPATS